MAQITTMTLEEATAIVEAQPPVTSEEDAAWDAFFAANMDWIEAMAEEAIEDLKTGCTEPLDPDTL